MSVFMCFDFSDRLLAFLSAGLFVSLSGWLFVENLARLIGHTVILPCHRLPDRPGRHNGYPLQQLLMSSLQEVCNVEFRQNFYIIIKFRCLKGHAKP